MSKVCIWCEIPKPFWEYYMVGRKGGNRPTRRKTYCKVCTREAAKAWNKAHYVKKTDTKDEA